MFCLDRNTNDTQRMRSTFQLVLLAAVAAFSLPLVMAGPAPVREAVVDGVEQGTDALIVAFITVMIS